jgi:sulfite reductase alpha subunit-like flavoprotein
MEELTERVPLWHRPLAIAAGIRLKARRSRMNEKILVAYATRTGTNQEVAQAMAQVLQEKGAAVEVRNVKQVDDPRRYSTL